MTTGRFGGGWAELERVCDTQKFASTLPTAMEKRMIRIGNRFVAEARKGIRDKKYESNSAITIALKGSSSPLIDNGDLIGAITFKVDKDTLTLWVGLNRQAKGKNGNIANVGAILHEGATVDVEKYPNVRKAVMIMLRQVADGKRRGDAAKAREIIDGMGTQTRKLKWVTPERPFIKDVVEARDFEAMSGEELQAGLDEAVGLSRRAA